MAVRAILVGLDHSEADFICGIMDRMSIPTVAYEMPAQALAVAQRGDCHLAIIGYEGDGCGLPLAVGMTMRDAGGLAFDCIVVTDKICPALAKAARDLGLLGVLVRPVRPGALASVVAAHIAKRLGGRLAETKAKAIA